MFKLTFALLLLVSGCQAQCTSDSCGDTDSLQTQMKVIMQRLDQLASENIELKATIEGHETNIREQETINQELRATTGRLETTNAELRTTNEQLRLRNEQLQTAIDSHQRNISQLQTTSTDLRTTNDQLRETVSSLQRNVTQMQATSSASAVYFSVAAHRIESYNLYDVIKFPVTYTNVVPAGTTGGWDAATNMFTCPVTGDYMFVVTLLKANGADYEDFSASLIHTSLSGADSSFTRLLNGKSSSVSGNNWFSSTMQAIVPCAAGEKVSVKAWCSSGCRLWDNDWHYSTFTGFKL